MASAEGAMIKNLQNFVALMIVSDGAMWHYLAGSRTSSGQEEHDNEFQMFLRARRKFKV